MKRVGQLGAGRTDYENVSFKPVYQEMFLSHFKDTIFYDILCSNRYQRKTYQAHNLPPVTK
jgi:hypothetical protein